MLIYEHDPSGNMRFRGTANESVPNIAGQPVTQVVEPGDSVTFSVVVSEVTAVAFQWKFNGAEIPGANADSLLLISVGQGNEGQYSVDVKSSHGIVTSAEASLLLDTDRDGLPDTWEKQNFGDQATHPSEGDPDQDGVSNIEEFRDGTFPTITASFRPRLTVSWDAGGSVEVSPRQLSYANGDQVQLAAAVATPVFHTAFPPSVFAPPCPPSVFARWEGDVETVADPTAETISLAMTRNRKVRAKFATPVPFPRGLVALWRGEGDAIDSVGGHHGSFFNHDGTPGAPACTTLPVHVGRAFEFLGNVHVRILNPLALRLPQMTVEAWVWQGVQRNTAQMIIACGSSGTTDDATWNLSVDDKGRARFWTRSLAGPADQLVDSSVLPLNQWTHVAATYDGETKCLYVNGVLVRPVDVQAGNRPGNPRAWPDQLSYDQGVPVTIGSSWVNGSSISRFTGLIDEVSLYNRALSANEIVDIFNADIAGKAPRNQFFPLPPG